MLKPMKEQIHPIVHFSYTDNSKVRYRKITNTLRNCLTLLCLLLVNAVALAQNIDESKFVCNEPTKFVDNANFDVVIKTGNRADHIPLLIPQPWTGSFGPAGILGGTVSNQGNVVDANTSNVATLTGLVAALGNGQRLTVQSNSGTIPSGYFAGFDIKSTAIFGATIQGEMRIETYLNDVLQEGSSTNNGSLSMSVANDQGISRVGFVTTKPFNRILIQQSQVLSVNLGTIDIYNPVIQKFCPETMPRPCNVLEYWTNNTFPVHVNQGNTGISNLLCANCTIKNTTNLVDGNINNFATIDFLGSIGTTGSVSVKNEKTVYPAGSFAGFDLNDQRLLSISIGATHTITTYLNGQERESVADGGALVDGGFFTSTGRVITGFKTKLSFDEVKLSVQNAGSVGAAPTNIYGAVVKSFCEGPALACNTNTKMVAPTYPVFVDGRNTGVNSLACIQCDIVGADNAIDADPNNYTQLVIPAGIATTAAYGITDGAKVYPANTFAGFDIENPNLIGVEALSGLTISTTNQYGVVIESFTGNNGLISAKSSLLNGQGRQTVGFLATQPFSGVKITVSSVIKANIGTTRIYNAVFKAFCKNDLLCNKLTPLTNPGYPVFVNGIRTSIDAAGCVACQINDSENIVNGASSIPATVVMGVSVGSTARVSVANALETYPIESFAGFDIESDKLLQGNVVASMVINLYNDGALVQSGTGTSLFAGVSSSLITGGANRQIVGLISKVPFDEVQLEIRNLAGVDLGTIKIYHAYVQKSCAVPLTCNFSTYLNSEDHGAVIDAAQTGTKGLACVGCSIQAPWNAVTKSIGDFARIYASASVGQSNSLAVAVPATTFPAGTFAGFTIKKNSFIAAAAIFPSIIVTTYLNGVEQESSTGGALFDFSALIQWFGTPTDFYNPGFYTTKPFDEVKISIQGLASALDQYVDVYGAFVDTRTAINGGGLACNVSNPDINVTFVNVPVNGNVSTNDKVVAGTTYGTPVAVPGVVNPNGSMPTVNADGTYSFVTNTPGVYQFYVLVCPPGMSTGCTNELLTITVLDANPDVKNPPVANTDIATTLVNTPVTINSLSNDKPGDLGIQLVAATVVLTDQNGALPGNTSKGGTATVNPSTGAITYTPPTGFVGKDTVRYTVCDNHIPALCASAYQIITVLPVGTANSTSAADDFGLTAPGVTLTVNAANGVKANDTDPEGDAQTVTAQTTTIPGKGTLTLAADGSYTFTPVAGFVGTVAFPYTTTDSKGATATATLYIVVDKVPDLTPTITITPSQVVGNAKTLNVRITVREINDVPTKGDIYVTIPVSQHYTVNAYVSNLSSINNLPVLNTQWGYMGIVGQNHVFKYGGTSNATTIAAKGSSAFGYTIIYNANAQSGKESVVVSIFDGSGGEKNFLNNKDSETVIYNPGN